MSATFDSDSWLKLANDPGEHMTAWSDGTPLEGTVRFINARFPNEEAQIAARREAWETYIWILCERPGREKIAEAFDHMYNELGGALAGTGLQTHNARRSVITEIEESILQAAADHVKGNSPLYAGELRAIAAQAQSHRQ